MLYGLGGARGVAMRPPAEDYLEEAWSPIPLFRSRDEVQAIIDARNAERGVGSLHVIEYEVDDG